MLTITPQNPREGPDSWQRRPASAHMCVRLASTVTFLHLRLPGPGRGKSREVRSAFVCAADNSSFPLYHTLGRVEFVVISILPLPDRFSPFPMDGASSPAAALVDTLKGVAVSAVAANVLGELWYIAGRDLRATRLVRAAAPYIGASW